MKNRSVFYSVRAAARGLAYAYTHERNFRLEVFSAIGAIVILFLLQGSVGDFIVVFFVITIIFLAEIVNTALERAVDIIKPHKHPYARVIKDLSAAFVFMSACSAGIIGFLIYIPLLVQRLHLL